MHNEREKLEDQQIKGFSSRIPSILAREMVGDWSMTTYVKPSGTPGTAPDEDVLFQCACGTKTVTPNTKVEYTLANQLDSFSMWVKKGNNVFAVRGCTVEKLDVSIGGDAIATLKWTGKYMQRLRCGQVAASGTVGQAATVITLASGGALRFQVGMYVTIGTDNNAGAGYQISAVNYNLNTITITPGLGTAQGSGPTVYPWWPVGAAEYGTPGFGKLGVVTVNGSNFVTLTDTLSLTNNITYYDKEKNDVYTAERFGRPGKRNVDGNLNGFFVDEAMSYIYRDDYNQKDALIIPVGNVAGSIMQINVPYAEYRAPKISGTAEYLVDIPFWGVASAAGNDELSFVFA
jgi:hypothetical protein